MVLCVEDPCAADPVIANMDDAASACENTNSEDTCDFTCVTGHTPSGAATCTTGTWDTPTCNPVRSSVINLVLLRQPLDM